MYITAAVGLGLSTIAVVLRVFTKARVLRSIQLEEYILVLSQLGFFAFTGLMIRAVDLGQGTHQWNVSIAHVQQVIQVWALGAFYSLWLRPKRTAADAWASQLSNVIEIIYCPIILGAKVAMLLQMRRMFIISKTGKLFWLHEILLWTNVPCYLALMLSFVFACIPREKLWNPTVPGRCISSNGSLIASSSLNVVSDVTMLLLPLVVILRLQLPLKSKLILSAVFGTGVLYVFGLVSVRLTELTKFITQGLHVKHVPTGVRSSTDQNQRFYLGDYPCWTLGVSYMLFPLLYRTTRR
jgi:hypothetical protein